MSSPCNNLILWGDAKNTNMSLLHEFADRAANEVRARNQSQGGKGDRPRSASNSARPRRRGERMSAPAASWCDPAGESPAQVKGSLLLGSECCVATGDSGCEAYTAIAWGVGLSHERSDIAGAESFYSLEGNMCGTAMRGADALPGSKATGRGQRPHHVQRDRIGTWEISCLAAVVTCCVSTPVRIGKARSRSR